MNNIALLNSFKSLADFHKVFTDEQVCRDTLEAFVGMVTSHAHTAKLIG